MRWCSLAWSLVVVGACTPDGTDDTHTPGGGAPIEASAVLSDVIGTVAFVSWTPPAAGESWVEYGLDPAALDRSTPHVPTGVESHEQIVLGLKTEHTYSWRAVTEADGVRRESAIGTITTEAAPPGVADMEVTVSDPTLYDPAPWLLTVTLGSTDPATVVIYDRDGDPVWFYESPSTVRKMHTARPGWDGKTIVFGYYDQNQDELLGGIYRVGMDGRSEIFSPTLDADHDFVERKDGTYAYLHNEHVDDVDVEGDIVDVSSNAIYETGEGDDPTVKPPTNVFSQLQDSGQELYWTCSHMHDLSAELPYHQWTHANSLIPDPVAPDDYYWMLYRWQDSLVRIDRTQGRIDWEIGGRYDDSDMTEDDAFDHGHMSHFWPGGFLMFDNNSHGAGVSRVREYTYDEATKHVALVHEWSGTTKTEFMADARRTDSGTMIVNWAGEDLIQERTDDDEVVWELTVEPTLSAGRLVLLNDLYDLDDPYAY